MTHFFLMSSNSDKVISKDREIENKTEAPENNLLKKSNILLKIYSVL